MTTPDRQDAFAELLQRHQRILFQVAHAYCRTPEDRNDVAQEIAVQLWRSFDRYDGRARFSTWMYRIALNVAISFQRRERVRQRHVLPATGGLLEVAAEAADGAGADEIDKLYRLIHSVPELDRALLLLVLDGHDHGSIGEILGLSTTNVGTKVHRLKQDLRARFDRDPS
jgi:RNA polymerase sigma-70 factor (ECF subfamily)